MADLVEKWEPKKGLSTKHKEILSLWAQGHKRNTIATICKCTPEFVTMVAATEQGLEYIKEINKAVDCRLEALYTRSVDAVSDALEEDQPISTRLDAAKLHGQMTGRINKKEVSNNATAEDIVQRLLQINIQVNTGDRS